MTGRILRLVFAAGLLALIWHLLDGAQIMDHLRAVDPVWLTVSAALLVGQSLLSALRWRLVAARLGHAIPWRRAVAEYFLAQSVNLALPGGVAGDAARAVRAGTTAGLRVAAQAVLFERLAGQVALMWVLVTATGAVALVPGGVTLPAPVLVAVAGVAGGLAVAWGGFALAARRRPKVAQWWDAARLALWGRDARAAQLGLSLGTVAANLAAFAAAAAAVGVGLPLPAILTILPLILLAMLLPLTPAGWGLREGAAAVLFPLAGASAAQGVAASAAFGGVFLVTSVVGMAVTWGVMRPAGWIGRRNAG